MDNLQEKAVMLLKENKLKITTAESCTGGLIAKMITDVSGASEVFECGFVTYANSIKHSILGVKEETLKAFGAVSEETVTEMSIGALKLSGADIAVAVSGIAGPSSDDTNKPVGLIWIAINFKGQIKTLKLNNNFNEDVRQKNRASAANEVFRLICNTLEE